MEHRWAQGLMLFLPALLCSQLRSMLGVLCPAGAQVVGLVACHRGWWLTHASDCRSRYQVLLQFPHRYFVKKKTGTLKEVFGELVGISIEGSPCSLSSYVAFSNILFVFVLILFVSVFIDHFILQMIIY